MNKLIVVAGCTLALAACSGGAPSNSEILKAWVVDYGSSQLPKSDFQCQVKAVVPYRDGADNPDLVKRYIEHCTGVWDGANAASFQMMLLRNGTYHMADLRVFYDHNG